MTEAELRNLLITYRNIIHDRCINDTDTAKHPRQMEEECYDLLKHNIPGITAARHVAWMCDKSRDLLEDGHVEKVMRWLGFIQGYLWCENMRTINQMRDDSRGDNK